MIITISILGVNVVDPPDWVPLLPNENVDGNRGDCVITFNDAYEAKYRYTIGWG